MDEQNMNLQYGWVCPLCGAVMAPHESVCINCRGYGSGIIAQGTPDSIAAPRLKIHTGCIISKEK